MSRYLFLGCCLLLLWGCENQSQTTSPSTQEKPPTAAIAPSKATVKLLHDTLVPHKFELPTEALQVWRKYQTLKPALVLFSAHPFLQPLDPAQRKDVENLIASGKDDQFYLRGSQARSNPALTPLQPLSAAIDSGLVSEVVWFFPTREKLDDFSADNLQQHMRKAGFFTAEEKPDLKLLKKGVIGGTVRGIPLRVIHPLAALPKLQKPTLVHVDLSYFQGLFKNEVATPVYNLLHETALTLRDANFDTLAVSLSYSTEGGPLSLATRFLIDDLAQMLEKPELLSGDMPDQWRYQSDALYTKEMYQETKSKELIADAAKKYPDDPALLYANMQRLLQQGKNDQGFKLLDRIVALDRGYAEEYLALAETGIDKGWFDQTLTLLDKAQAVHPDDPFIQLFKVEVLIKAKRGKEALPILKGLQRLNWSPIYYPQMQQQLKNRIEAIQKGKNQSAHAG